MLHQGPIIWDVGRSSVVAFTDAMMVVRATEVVKEAFHAGTLPPDPFPASKLSGTAQRPSLNELKTTFRLSALCGLYY
ncbi:hypothetical protein VTO42DRAFT_8240 [Malbranchea cinnamomea]